MNYKTLKTYIFLITFFSTMMLTAQSNLIDLVNSYSADKRALNKFYTNNESQEYYQRFTTLYTNWEKKVTAIDFDDLNQQEKVDYLLLKNLIEKETYFFNLDYKAFKEVVNISDFAKDIFPFIQERRRGKKPDAQTLAKILHNATAQIDTEIKTLNEKPFKDWLMAEKASKVISSFQKSLKEAYSFYYSYDPEFTWWVQKPFEELSTKLLDYANLLNSNYSKTSIKDDGSGIIGKPIGKDALIESLNFEFIPYTPEQLIKTAESQFNWCKEEMIKASKELGYGTNWKAALEHVKNTYVAAGEQPQAITDLYNQSVEFIEERDLITFPEMAKETWGMIMMTPERQKVNPFFTGGWEISISYPTQDMSEDDKLMSMRGNNPNFSRATVQHELLPGHNLQFFMNARNKSYRRAFDTPFWMEGWALYWEINLWNKEFPQTPEQKLGMLFWRIHRCARIIFSLKYHLGDMTPQQCIDMLVNEVGHEYANAEAEVRRSFATSYTPPLYQMAYMTGGLQFYALRNEMLKKGWTEKQFHDRVLQENMMPVELLRSLIQELPLKENFKTNWKFSTEFK
ncbi:DUF885 family protein [Mariniflexile litorale]|uniref:DUF885 family protein n=1 Tax=Mariniflexile litorale TaxID=3045158 RepID=A0AAU7EDL4_9FLAO|nr:DUF885 family protein [Mariniflexile sp. KMM 9835]MDQ8212876.1 DUF885 family protein [Mariniflexile sp. KMM 9835]